MVLRQNLCTQYSCAEYIDEIQRDQADFDLLIVLLCYLFKKNIRFNYLKEKTQTAEDSSRFGELNVIYDFSPEQTYLKLFIRASMHQSGQKKIHLDLICNEFEYEILYKRAFSQAVNVEGQELIPTGQQTRHKRGYSQGNYSVNNIGGTNASPASHISLFGSPPPSLKQQ